MAIVKDLGMVTAYAYAVAGGYEGTEAEFTELLGQAGVTLEQLESLSAVAVTLAPGSEATASYSDGVLTFGIPHGDKGDKGDTGNGITSIAKTGTSGLVDTYTITYTNGNTMTFTVTNGAQGNPGPTGNGISSIAKTGTSGLIDTYTITFTDGNTTTFTVTNGEDGTVTPEQMAAAIAGALVSFATGKHDNMTAGLAEQLLSDVQTTDKKPYLFRRTGADATREYDCLVGGSVVANQLFESPETVTANDITFTKTDAATVTLSGTASAQAIARLSAQSITNHIYYLKTGTSDTNVDLYNDIGGGLSGPVETIKKANADRYIYLRVLSGATVSGSIKPQIVDLTKMFGSSIADHAYTLEQATAGSGIAWLKSYGFFVGYQAYNAGAMAHVSGVEAHVMTGFNQWDEEIESGYIDPTTGAEMPDANKIRMKNYMPVLPNTAYYKKTPLPFHNVYFDANKQYISYGNAAQGVFTTPPNCHFIRSGFETSYGTTYKNNICINFSNPALNGTYKPYQAWNYPLDDSVILRGIPKLSNGELYYDGDTYAHDGTVTRYYGIRAYQAGDESLTDAITDGTNTVYKLTTPTTESATPYQSPQICDPDGTEQYVTDGIPVGHETQYPANLKGEIERVMVQVPKPPTSNGTYTLKCTVAASGVTYAWTT